MAHRGTQSPVSGLLKPEEVKQARKDILLAIVEALGRMAALKDEQVYSAEPNSKDARVAVKEARETCKRALRALAPTIKDSGVLGGKKA